MTNAEAAHITITLGADAKNPLLARILTKMAQELLENPSDEFHVDNNPVTLKVMTDVISDMVNEAAEEMDAIVKKHKTNNVEELFEEIFSQLL